MFLLFHEEKEGGCRWGAGGGGGKRSYYKWHRQLKLANTIIKNRGIGCPKGMDWDCIV